MASLSTGELWLYSEPLPSVELSSPILLLLYFSEWSLHTLSCCSSLNVSSVFTVTSVLPSSVSVWPQSLSLSCSVALLSYSHPPCVDEVASLRLCSTFSGFRTLSLPCNVWGQSLLLSSSLSSNIILLLSSSIELSSPVLPLLYIIEWSTTTLYC